jgi:hypothetical protein
VGSATSPSHEEILENVLAFGSLRVASGVLRKFGEEQMKADLSTRFTRRQIYRYRKKKRKYENQDQIMAGNLVADFPLGLSA